MNGNIPGRESDEERIFAYKIGVSVHDINFAVSIYQLMKEHVALSSLPAVDMRDPTEKFWL